MLSKPRYKNGNCDEIFLGYYHQYDLYFDAKMKMPSIISADHTGSKCAIFMAKKSRDNSDSFYPLKMAYDLAVKFKIYEEE